MILLQRIYDTSDGGLVLFLVPTLSIMLLIIHISGYYSKSYSTCNSLALKGWGWTSWPNRIRCRTLPHMLSLSLQGYPTLQVDSCAIPAMSGTSQSKEGQSSVAQIPATRNVKCCTTMGTHRAPGVKHSASPSIAMQS